MVKKKEMYMNKIINNYLNSFKYQYRVGRFLIDWAKLVNNNLIGIELDERSHVDRCPLNEIYRLVKIYNRIQKPIIIFRINSDIITAFKGKPQFKFIQSVFNKRLALLIKLVIKTEKKYRTMQSSNIKIIYLYYSSNIKIHTKTIDPNTFLHSVCECVKSKIKLKEKKKHIRHIMPIENPLDIKIFLKDRFIKFRQYHLHQIVELI